MFNQSETNILVAGHRGYAAKYPENTMISFEKAIELGVDAIELDINITADKQLVVIHDQKVDRTTNGTGLVADMTLEELKALDAGGWFDKRFAGAHIPTLAEFLDLVIKFDPLLLNVEIKSKTFETVDLTVKELERYNLLGRIVMTCFDAEIVTYISRRYELKTQGFPGSYMSNFKEDTNSFLYAAGIHMRDLTKELCDYFKSRNIDPWSYPADTDELVCRSVDCGVTMLTCNDPEPALRILKEKGLHQ